MSVVGAKKVDSPPLSLFPARSIWTLALNSQITTPPAFDNERVYFAIDDERLVAYSIVEGSQLWLVPARPLTKPAVGDGMVFAAEPDDLIARRVTDGTVAWRHPLAGTPSAPLVWDSGWLITVSSTGSVEMCRATDGQVFWSREIGSAAAAAPAIAGEHVYIPTVDGRVVALSVEKGEPVWERHLGGAASDVLVVDDRLYTGSKDNFFYCLMTKTGRVDWRWRTGGDVIGLPAVEGHSIYFVSLDNVLRALNRISGGQQWMRPLPVRPVWGPVKVVDRLIVGGQANSFPAFNLKDGTSAGSLDGGAEAAAAPHLVADPASPLPVVLVVTRDIAKGAAARLMTRRLDPEATVLSDPLPNLIKMGPTQPGRP